MLTFSGITKELGIGTNTPASALSVGASSEFQVTSGGEIAAAQGITSAGTIRFTALATGLNTRLTLIGADGTVSTLADGTSGQVLQTNGNGGYSWINAATGTVTQINTTGPLNGGPITSTGTLSIDQATTAQDGYLSATDWNTFNNKQNALTFGNLTSGTTGISITGGTGAVIGSGTSISIQTASGSQQGLLSAVDWNTFNNKQDAITTGTTAQYLRGDLSLATLNTSVVPENGNLYFTAERVDDRTAALIQNGTGLSWTYNDVANTLTGNVTLAPFTTDDLAEGSTNLYWTQGRFDTAFNAKDTDDLTEGASNLYFTQARARAAISASTPINYNSLTGVISCPDCVTSSGGSYVSSLNTLTGALTIEGTTNQVNVNTSGSTITLSTPQNIHSGANPTFAGIRLSGLAAALGTTTELVVVDGNGDTSSLADGTAGQVLSTDGDGNLSWVSAAGGTVTQINTSGPLTGGPITSTGTIGITQATGSTDGYLSSTDWNTFNAKQDAITTGTTAQYLRGDLSLATLDTSVVPENGNLYFTAERVDDRAAALIQNGTGLAWTYDDAIGTLTGNVSLSSFDTDDLAEGVTNLYFTNARARAAISATSPISYSSATGVISCPTCVTTSSGGYVTSLNGLTGAIDIVGTPNQVNVNESGSEITLSLPQNIHTGASPTFSGLTLSGVTAGAGSVTELLSVNSSGVVGVVADGSSGEFLTTDGNGNLSWVAGATGTVTEINTTGPLTGGPITTSGTISITQAGSTTDGYLSSVDWNTFNSKQNALTLGDLTTTTTGVSITGGTGAVIGSGATVNIQTANSTQPGLLSAANWNTFNNKQDAITTGTTAQYLRGDLSLATLDTSAVPENGNLYYTAERVDDRVATLIQSGTGLIWNYNDALNTLTGDVSLSAFTTDDLAEGSTNLYFTQARARAALSGVSPITYNSTTGEISCSTCLTSGGNYVSSLNSVVGAITIQGTTNQVNVNTAGQTITLSLPQNIHNGASPTFTGLTLSGLSATAGKTRELVTVNSTGDLTKVADGTAGQFLTTDGAGNLTWASGSTGTVTGTGTDNRLARWNAAGTGLENGSVNDLYTSGTALTIDAEGDLAVGATSAISQFDSFGNGSEFNMRLSHAYTGGVSTYSALGFGTESGTKSAIYWVQDSNWARGSLHFAVNVLGDNSGVSTAHTKMAINSTTGFVGIGTTTPNARLDVESTTAEKLRLTYTDNSVYGSLSVGSGGVLELGGSANRTQATGASNALSFVAAMPYDGGVGGWGGIGLGTAAPKTALIFEQSANWSRGKLHIAIDPAEDYGTAQLSDSVATFDLNGRLGLGTTTPGVRLDVNGDMQLRAQGDARFADADSSNYVALQSPATVGSNYTLTLPNAVAAGSNRALVGDASGNLSWYDLTNVGTVTGSGTQNYLTKWNAAGTGLVNSLVFDNGTNVGIGTTTPGSLLDVGGVIRAVNGADFITIDPSSSGTPTFRMFNSGVQDAIISIPGNQFNFNIGIVAASGNITASTGALRSGACAVGLGAGNVDLCSNSGNGTGISFNENTIANRGILGFAGGSGDLVYRQGATSFATGTELFRIASNGNVGIGNTNPGARLHLGGTLRLDSGSYPTNISNSNLNNFASELNIQAATSNRSTLVRIFPNGTPGLEPRANLQLFNTDWFNSQSNYESLEFRFNNNVAQLLSSQGGSGVTRPIQITTGTNNGIYILANGNVGIGNTNPGTALDITGDAQIRAQGDLRLADSDSSNYVALQSPATIGSNFTLTLPSAVAGGSNYALVGDATGALSWYNLSSFGAGTVTGTGTQNYLTKWNAAGTGLENSLVFDNGTNVGIGTTTPDTELEIEGDSGNQFRITNGGTTFDISNGGLGNVTLGSSGLFNLTSGLSAGFGGISAFDFQTSNALGSGDSVFNIRNGTSPLLKITGSATATLTGDFTAEGSGLFGATADDKIGLNLNSAGTETEGRLSVISPNTNADLFINAKGTSGIQLNSDSGSGGVGIYDGAGGRRAYFNSGGSLYLGGSSSPANRLSVNGSASFGTYASTAAPSNGLIVSGDVGIGTSTVNARLESLATTQQLRLSYDTLNFSGFTVSSSGDLTIDPTGGDLAVDGNILPGADGQTLGAVGNSWESLYVQGLIAMNDTFGNTMNISVSAGNTGFISAFDALNFRSSAYNSGDGAFRVQGNVAGQSGYLITSNPTLNAMDGSDTVRGWFLDLTNADHTGTGNSLYGIDIDTIVADADATEVAFRIGGGWDTALQFMDSDGTNSISINAPATADLTSNYTLTLPSELPSSAGTYNLVSDQNGVMSFVAATSGTGDITSVGSMLANDAFADSSADGQWLGLGASAGRLSFNLNSTDPDSVSVLDARFGIGTAAPAAQLHAISTTEQLRLGYDASNYLSTTIGAAGGVTFDATGTGSRFTFADDVYMTTGNLVLGTGTSTNALLTFNSTGIGETSPTIGSTTAGDLTLSAPTGRVQLSGGSGDIILNPVNSNLRANLTGTGDFLIQDDSSTFVTFADDGTTTFDFAGTTANAITANVNSLTSGKGLAIATTSNGLSSGALLELASSATGTSTAFTGDIASIQYSPTYTGGTGLNTTGSVMDISRNLTLNNSGNTLTVSGELFRISDTFTQTAGTLAVTANTASISRSCPTGVTCNGALLYINSSGSGVDSVGLQIANTGGTLTSDIQLQNGETISNSTDGQIKIGNTASLVLGAQASDPTGTNGATYYNTTTNKFRCYQNGAWVDCISTGTGSGTIGGSGTAGVLTRWASNGTDLEDASIQDLGSAVAMTIDASGDVGIGTSGPSAALEVMRTTEQLRLSYDLSNYFSTTVGSTGGVTFDAAGSASSFTFNDNVGIASGGLTLGTAGTSNGLLTFNSSSLLVTAPSIGSNSDGDLSILAPSGVVNIGSGTGDIVLDPGTSNLVANLTGSGDFTIQDNGATFVTFSDTGVTTFDLPTATDGVIMNGDSLTTGDVLTLSSLSNTLSSGGLLDMSYTSTSGSTAFTGSLANITFNKTLTGGTSLDNTGTLMDISRNLTLNNSGNTATVSGAAFSVTDTFTQTAGTLALTGNTAQITRVCPTGVTCSGSLLSLTGSGAGTDTAGLSISKTTGTLTTGIVVGSGTQTIGTGIRLGSTGITTDIQFQNNATLSNDTSGQLAVSANTSLVLGSASSDPTGTNGAMYYNTTSNTFRCYQNGAWAACGGAGSVSGTGTAGRLTRWNSTGDGLENSSINDLGSAVAMTINASGNVGIGNASPTALFDIDANSLSSGVALDLSSTSTSFSSGTLANISWNPTSATTATGDLFRLSINSNANIGNFINILDNNTSIFSVSESGFTTSLPVSFTAPGDLSVAYDIALTNQTASYIRSNAPLYIDAGEVFESNNLTLTTFNSGRIVLEGAGGIDIGGTVRPTIDNSYALGASGNRFTEVFATNGTINTSDSRLKTNVASMEAGLAEIMQLRPVSYDWTDGSNNQKKLGLIAQEVQEILPEVVHVGTDKNKTLGISYSDVVPVLISGIQEQQSMIDTISLVGQDTKSKTDALNSQISSLSSQTNTRISRIEAGMATMSAALASLEGADINKVSSIEAGLTSLEVRTASLETEVASLSAKLTDLVLGANTASGSGSLATSSAELDELTVSGNTNLNDLGVTGTINAGLLNIEGLDAFGESAINTLGGPLKLQSLGINGVEMVGGKVAINTDGSMIVTGELTTKKVTIDTTEETSASLGKGTVLAGETSVIIETTSITADSLVFVTATTKTGRSLSVTSQITGESFTVELSGAESKDITFNWWIVDSVQQ